VSVADVTARMRAITVTGYSLDGASTIATWLIAPSPAVVLALTA